MPTKKCDICGKRVTVKVSEWKYLDKNGSYAHHHPCVLKWLDKNGTKPFLKSHFYGAHDGYGYVLPFQLRPYRSTYEEVFASKMDALKWPFLYEAVEFKWGLKVYTPDFYFFDRECFVEIKGMWQPSQRSKYKSFRKEFPDVRLLVVPWISRSDYYETETVGGVGEKSSI